MQNFEGKIIIENFEEKGWEWSFKEQGYSCKILQRITCNEAAYYYFVFYDDFRNEESIIHG